MSLSTELQLLDAAMDHYMCFSSSELGFCEVAVVQTLREENTNIFFLLSIDEYHVLLIEVVGCSEDGLSVSFLVQSRTRHALKKNPESSSNLEHPSDSNFNLHRSIAGTVL